MSMIVIMPGGFHPFHAGHYALYQSAKKAFPGADLYVAATNDQSERPFPFQLKEKLAKLAGVESGHFIQVKSPFQAKEITQNYDPESDVLVFVRSEKDRNEPPKPGGTKKDGSPAYFQPWTGKNLQPFSKHAYIHYLPTVEFGPGITSATQIRKAWPTLNDKRKLALVMSLYPATQKNPKLAQNVVGMFDQVMGGQVEEGVVESKHRIHPDIEEFLDSLSPDDVGVEEFGPYRVYYEGFTDDCQSSSDYCKNPEAVYQQVYNDFIKRENGAKPVDSGMVGDEDYPILYSIFKITKNQKIDTPERAYQVAYYNKKPWPPGSPEERLIRSDWQLSPLYDRYILKKKVKEGVAEGKKITQDLEFRTRRKDNIIEIYAELDGVIVGYAKFNIRNNTLVAGKVTVDPEYRRQGIATAIYDYAEKQGYTIIPSQSQTELGQQFWKDRESKRNMTESTDILLLKAQQCYPNNIDRQKSFVKFVQEAIKYSDKTIVESQEINSPNQDYLEEK